MHKSNHIKINSMNSLNFHEYYVFFTDFFFCFSCFCVCFLSLFYLNIFVTVASTYTQQQCTAAHTQMSLTLIHFHEILTANLILFCYRSIPDSQVNLGHNLCSHGTNTILTDGSDLNFNDTMTCQELLAFSVAFSAALPTNQNTLDSFYSSLANHEHQQLNSHNSTEINTNSDVNNRQVNVISAATAPTTTHVVAPQQPPTNCYENFSCCYHLYQNSAHVEALMSDKRKPNKFFAPIVRTWRILCKVLSFSRRYIKVLVEHKYFQQGILLAILINTLSMGIEYHDQPEELTVIVETSNIVFSGIFAVEMLLKVIAEGPFRYIANGFNVFDGVIVLLR